MTVRILLCSLMLTLGPTSLAAAPQAGGGGAEAKTSAKTQSAGKVTKKPRRKGGKRRARPVPLMAVVRGLYVEAQWGGGYSVLDSTVGTLTADEQRLFPTLTEDDREQLGAGARFGVAIGYDLLDKVALQVVAGATMIGGRREDRVRDLAMFYVGFGPHFGFDLSSRLYLVFSLAGLGMRASDGIDKLDKGFGVLASAGLEYFVHVRHFSVGADVSVLVGPLSNIRAFVAVSPLTLKYTF